MDPKQALELFPIVFRRWLRAQTNRPAYAPLSQEEDKEFRRFLRDIHKSPYKKQLIKIAVNELSRIKQQRPRKTQTLFHNLFPHDKIIRSLYRNKTDSVYFDILFGLLSRFCIQNVSCKKTHLQK